jgi:hypothetical protein
VAPGGGVWPGATRSCSCAAGAPGGGVGGLGAAGGDEAAGGVGWLISGCACGVGAAGGAACGGVGGGGGTGCGAGAAAGGGADRGGGAAGGVGRCGGAAAGGLGGGGAAAGGLAGAGAAFGGAPLGGCFGFPSGPSSSLAWATTIGAVCACDAVLANCIIVKAVEASSTRRRCGVMMMEVPRFCKSEVLAAKNGSCG